MRCQEIQKQAVELIGAIEVQEMGSPEITAQVDPAISFPISLVWSGLNKRSCSLVITR
jgi:hypothetical protein